MIAQEILNLTQSILDKFGTRLTGSASCKAAFEFIKPEFGKYCDTIKSEQFITYPDSFRNIGKIYSLSYIAATIFLFLGSYWLIPSCLIFTFGSVYCSVRFIYFGSFFERCFKKDIGNNVIGTIEPAGEVKRQIIVSGHYDSPYVLNFLTYFQKLYAIRSSLGIFTFVLAQLISYIALFFMITGNEAPVFFTAAKYTSAIGIIFTGPMYFIISKKASPGAGDNLIAVTLALKIAEFFSKKRNSDRSLMHTRIIFFIPDAEEIGLRGSTDFVKKHKDELLSIDTFVINIDSLYKYKDLILVTKDRNGTIKLSEYMANELKTIANKRGYNVRTLPIPFGGGGTDAASFAKIGINAVSIIGISTNFIRDGLVYHTLNDTVEHIEPKIVEACYNIIIDYINIKDSGI
jgi:aminopeptidase YwaD